MSDQQPSHRLGTRSWQFGTRALFGGVTACALLLLVLQRVGLMWSVFIVWFLILAAAHVVANAFGTHHAVRRTITGISAEPVPHSGEDVRCAPATQLRDRRGFGRALLAIIVVSTALGGLFGTAGLLLLTPANMAGVALGGFSAAILGGFLGFVAGSFVMVATRSFREASGTQQRARVNAS